MKLDALHTKLWNSMKVSVVAQFNTVRCREPSRPYFSPIFELEVDCDMLLVV